MLTTMFALSFISMVGDTAIVDEVAHIPAGYSYLRYGDFRLNPEHPPLIKDLAGLPLQFMELKFPDDSKAWTTQVNGQWEVGWDFLYHLGNDASRILFWSRLPILVLAIAFGGYLYEFVRRRWGVWAALVALLAYCFSPNFLAHSHYVTTDLGASVFMFITLVVFLRFASRPTRANIVVLSLALAGAQLAKFSAILLYPFLALMCWLAALVWPHRRSAWRSFRTYFFGLIAASVGSLIWIYLYYIPHVINMPYVTQKGLIDVYLSSGIASSLNALVSGMGQIYLLRPLSHYLLGLGMVFGRVAGGNVTYFLGEVTDGSFKAYFPVLFLLKTQIPLLLVLASVIASGLYFSFRSGRSWQKHLNQSLRDDFALWLLGLFAAFYFLVAVLGNLDLGIRHILPVYPPLFVVAAVAVTKLVRRYSLFTRSTLAPVAAVLLATWYIAATLWSAPHYLSYFNEFIAGGANADKYFSDSSVDWGQDLLRLHKYLSEHPEIDKVAVDYFGGADPRYYFCVRLYNHDGSLVADASGYDCKASVYVEWHAQYGKYTGQWIVVSETFLENDRHYAKLYNRPGYDYLRARQPVAKIGNSLYLYQLY